jgi:TRAP-type C4-dicarboxylate transport system substrate-binding protein
MAILGRIAFAAAGAALALQMSAANADELVYGAWPPAGEYLNRVALPKIFADIKKETNGAITWKLVPGGQLAGPKETFQAAGDGVITAGLGIVIYVPNLLPSVNAIYSTLVFGNDVVAATGAAVETMTLHCPSCIAESKKINVMLLSGWASAGYQLACRSPIATLDDLKGKRVRANGGSAELVHMAGGVPVGATLPEAANLLQHGGLDCQLGVNTWLKVFGYADFAKNLTDYPLGMSGPAIGLLMNRDTWNKMTPDQKKVHLKAAAHLSAELAIGQFMDENDEILKDLQKTKDLKVINVSDKANWDALVAKYEKAQHEKNVADAKKFGVANPAAVVDAYAVAFQKWSKLSPGIGRDVGKFTDALWNEVYSKVDPSKL